MSADHEVPGVLDVISPTVEALQELQVVLGLEDHSTPGRALETTLIWYDDVTAAGNVLRFSPPASQRTWQGYTRSLELDPAASAGVEDEITGLRIEGEAQHRLAQSETLLHLATMHGLGQMVRLKAEHAFRLADDWTIKVDIDKRGTS